MRPSDAAVAAGSEPLRISDLLHQEVYDAEWRPIGRVQDVRLVQDGPLQGLVGAAFRVDGLVVGRFALGVRLGFHRGEVKGPWALKWFFGRLERRARYVSWDVVDSWDENGIRASLPVADLPGVPAGG
jgi:hypothetical protein